MPYAIQLYFDEDTTAAIRAIWRELTTANLAPYLHGSGNHPHVTAAIYAEIDSVQSRHAILAWSRATAPFPLTFSHLGVFTTPKPVMWAGPTVTAVLQRHQQALHTRLLGIAREPAPYYLPDHWVPHCTLAMDFSSTQWAPVLAAAQSLSLPLSVTVVSVGVIEFRPVQHLFSCQLVGDG